MSYALIGIYLPCLIFWFNHMVYLAGYDLSRTAFTHINDFAWIVSAFLIYRGLRDYSPPSNLDGTPPDHQEAMQATFKRAATAARRVA
ncbi:MAG TPA: hypothetical protein VLU25_21260 [Acidobacteriota bacterium]|nr:hypothetical protein [Acidobacteriota bacterium]